METSEGYSEIFIQNNETQNNETGLPIESTMIQDNAHDLFSTGQRLEKAWGQIERFIDRQFDAKNSEMEADRPDVVVANLDVLITRVKDILLQVEQNNAEQG